MNRGKYIFFLALIAIMVSSCSAPQIEDDFLTDEYYTNTKNAHAQNGSYKLQSKVDSLILELNRVQFRLLQMQLDYLTLSNNMMNLQLHAAELKIMQHLKEHEILALKENSAVKNESADGGNIINDGFQKPQASNSDLSGAEAAKTTNIGHRTREEMAVDDSRKRSVMIFDNIYEEGILLFNGKKYIDAVEKFDALLKLDARDSSLVDNSYYWLGECYFALGNYATAIENFKKVIEIKESNKNADALVMLAQTYEKLEWKELARETYKKFIETYPKNKNIQFAKARLKGLE